MKVIINNFLSELNQEITATKNILKLVPIEKYDWKPHEKSMSLGRLATHVAEIPSWFAITINQDVLDFATMKREPFIAKINDELMEFFNKNIKEAIEVLNATYDDKLDGKWTMRAGDTIYFTLSKVEVVRTWCFNHWYHHRAQLGVYLRLLEIPLPGTYGPSADYS